MRRLLALALFAALFANPTAFAQDKDKKDNDNQPPKLSKQERKYQEIKKFALDLYNKDPEFRDKVEDAYRQKMREHSEYAYDLNTRNYGDTQIMRNGDKLKIYDALYDNPLAQDYVNRVGQSIVPATSQHLYAFNLACPHENTALKWLPKDGRFQCPKHESRYQPTGTFIDGRATRHMDRLGVRLDSNMLVVDLNQFFRSDKDAAGWAAANVAL